MEASIIAADFQENIAGTMNLVELNLLAGDYDEAIASYRWLSTLDRNAGHAGHILHGMVEVEIYRDRWRHALDHLIIATAVDRSRLTTDLLAFVIARLFGSKEHPAPPRFDVESRLRARRAEHRRLHAEIPGDFRADFADRYLRQRTAGQEGRR